MRLTTVTIAKNEEEHIARALRSVRDMAEEMIVVDAESNDRTVQVAREFTEKVFSRPWPGYGPQKNFALGQATGDWVLFLDADEEVPPALANEIRETLARCLLPAASCPKVYFVRIITEFLGRPLSHLWGTNPRLLRRPGVAWDTRTVHEQVTRRDGSTVRLGDPDVGALQEPLLHPSHYRTLRAYLEKRAQYTTRDAEEMVRTGGDRLGKSVGNSFSSPWVRTRFLLVRALKKFVRLFILKRGFLDGWQGWLWCWLSAQYEYMVAKKYLDLLRQTAHGNR